MQRGKISTNTTYVVSYSDMRAEMLKIKKYIQVPYRNPVEIIAGSYQTVEYSNDSNSLEGGEDYFI